MYTHTDAIYEVTGINHVTTQAMLTMTSTMPLPDCFGRVGKLAKLAKHT